MSTYHEQNRAEALPDTKEPERGAALRINIASKAARAAEARQTTPLASDLADKRLHENRKMFIHLIERELGERNAKVVALSALETMEKITNNILKNPNEQKFKMLKHSNALIKKNVIDVPGAREYLLACKFSPGVREHVETFTFPAHPSEKQLGILSIGHEILIKKIHDIKIAHETEMNMKQKEEDAEKRRVTVALTKIREDREGQKARTTREQMARRVNERQGQVDAHGSHKHNLS